MYLRALEKDNPFKYRSLVLCMEQSYVRSMTFGEILDASVKLYRKDFIPLVTAQLPMTAFYLGTNLSTWVALGLIQSGLPATTQAYPEVYEELSQLMNFFLIILVLAFVQIAFVYPLSLGAMTKVTSDSILTGKSSAKSGFQFFVDNWFSLGVTNVILSLFLGLILGIGLIIGFLCFGIGLLLYAFFWTRLQATYPVIVNEHIFVVSAMQRSWNLVKGNTIRVFFVLLVISLIPYVLIFSPVFMEMVLGTSSVGMMLVFGTLSQGLLIPLVAVARVVIFFELKARKEGFDIERRVEELQ